MFALKKNGFNDIKPMLKCSNKINHSFNNVHSFFLGLFNPDKEYLNTMYLSLLPTATHTMKGLCNVF